MFRRWPKRGFSNANFTVRYHVVNVSDLNSFDAGSTVDAAVLIAAGKVPDGRLPLKILGEGEISSKLTILADAFSKSAIEKIEAAGGAVQSPKGEAYTPAKVKKHVDPAEKFARKQSGNRKRTAAAPAADAPASEAAPAAAAEEKPAE